MDPQTGILSLLAAGSSVLRIGFSDPCQLTRCDVATRVSILSVSLRPVSTVSVDLSCGRNFHTPEFSYRYPEVKTENLASNPRLFSYW